MLTFKDLKEGDTFGLPYTWKVFQKIKARQRSAQRPFDVNAKCVSGSTYTIAQGYIEPDREVLKYNGGFYLFLGMNELTPDGYVHVGTEKHLLSLLNYRIPIRDITLAKVLDETENLSTKQIIYKLISFFEESPLNLAYYCHLYDKIHKWREYQDTELTIAINNLNTLLKTEWDSVEKGR